MACKSPPNAEHCTLPIGSINGSEPPFLISQTIVMAVFVVLAIAAAIKFHPETVHAS